MNRTLPIAFAVFCLSACGDDDSSAGDGGVSDTSTATGGEIAAELREAEFELSAGQCDCRFERDGYESAAACVADLDAITPAVRECIVDSAAPYIGELRASFDCLLSTTRDYIACNEATTCEDSAQRTTCFETAEAARRLCPTSEAGFSALDDELECLSALFVGPAEDACPDVTASGTGEIATFDTTLRGNDTMGGCGFGDQADVSVEWAAPAAGEYEFRVESAADVYIYVLASCGGVEIECDTDTTLTLSLEADETIIIVVDGYSRRDVGDVTLSVAAL